MEAESGFTNMYSYATTSLLDRCGIVSVVPNVTATSAEIACLLINTGLSLLPPEGHCLQGILLGLFFFYFIRGTLLVAQ